MRLLHTADWHVGKTLKGKNRSDEHEAVFQEIIEVAKEQRVDIAVVAGDLFDVAAPTAESEKIVYRALIGLSKVAEHVVILSGNHDNPRRLEAIKPLLELTNIHVSATLERPEDGGLLEVKTERGETAEIALFPFLSQKGIVRADELMSKDAYEHAQDYQDRADRIIKGLCKSMSRRAINIFIGHAMLHGGVLGGGERSAHTVFEYGISTTAFPGSLHYAAMGHLHRAQKLAAGCPIWYSGSPLQLDFGETADVKVVNLVDCEAGKPSKVEQVALSKGKRLRTVQGTMDEVLAQSESFSNDYIRIVLKSMAIPGLADEVREKLPNTIDVRIEAPEVLKEKKPQAQSRQGRSPADLFSEYLSSIDANDKSVEKLFSELLDEAHASDNA